MSLYFTRLSNEYFTTVLYYYRTLLQYFTVSSTVPKFFVYSTLLQYFTVYNTLLQYFKKNTIPPPKWTLASMHRGCCPSKVGRII
jgi:hypothetical protein